MPRKTTTDKTPRAKTSASAGRFSYDGLDRVLHEKARLGILASLAANPEGLVFNDLKQLCVLTDGNLSRHLTVLHEAGLLETWKGTAGPRPQQARGRAHPRHLHDRALRPGRGSASARVGPR